MISKRIFKYIWNIFFWEVINNSKEICVSLSLRNTLQFYRPYLARCQTSFTKSNYTKARNYHRLTDKQKIFLRSPFLHQFLQFEEISPESNYSFIRNKNLFLQTIGEKTSSSTPPPGHNNISLLSQLSPILFVASSVRTTSASRSIFTIPQNTHHNLLSYFSSCDIVPRSPQDQNVGHQFNYIKYVYVYSSCCSVAVGICRSLWDVFCLLCKFSLRILDDTVSPAVHLNFARTVKGIWGMKRSFPLLCGTPPQSKNFAWDGSLLFCVSMMMMMIMMWMICRLYYSLRYN